jgi:hypothetical protein
MRRPAGARRYVEAALPQSARGGLPAPRYCPRAAPPSCHDALGCSRRPRSASAVGVARAAALPHRPCCLALATVPLLLRCAKFGGRQIQSPLSGAIHTWDAMGGRHTQIPSRACVL